MPVPKLELAPVAAMRDRIGDRGILRGFVWGDQAGPWQHACCLMDVNELIYRTFDRPDWVHELLETLTEKKLQFVESMKGAAFDLVETGGGAASSTVISPKLHREFCLPYDRRIHDALRSLGLRSSYHTCGGTVGIEDLIVENGCDVSETLAPPSVGGNQEPWEFKRKIAGRLALIGGLDQYNVLTTGSKKRIREKVHELFERVGCDGGYICALSDHFFDAPLENLQAYADAARECVY
jgi:uroporphyrinogen-III decarboxylase